MKRFTVGLAMASILAVSAYSVAGAQAPRGGAGFGPRGEGPGAGRGANMMMMLRGLDLTEAQRNEVRTILQSERGALEAVRTEARLHRELRAELLADVPDALKLASLQQQLTEAHATRLAAQITVGQQLAQVLTPEQRATVRERVAQAPQRLRGGPEGRTGGARAR